MSNQELHDAADRLIDEARSYFQLMQKRGLAGGCIWITAQDGSMVIFTRGEYRERLLHNIEMEIDAKRVHQFGVAETT